MRLFQFLGFVLVALFLFSSVSVADVIYVKEGATGTGASWTDAFGNLQNALDIATTGDEIWVAAGVYKPTSDYGRGIGTRGKHFRMINGVTIYGGFPAGGDTFANREPNQYETILSGDIGLPSEPNDNCCHVFFHPDGLGLDPNAVLDGFTITAGNADDPSLDYALGGGIYNYRNSPTIKNCIFTENQSYIDGGGMYNYESNLIVIGCIFRDNSVSYDGGGMNNNRGSPTVTDCAFIDNSSGYYGGGMSNSGSGNGYNRYCNPVVTNCIFEGNLAGSDGGAMYNNRYSSPELANCVFAENSAMFGGAIYNVFSSTLAVTGCIFRDNSVSYYGGGIYYDSQGSLAVTNCVFSGNSSGSDGGGLYLSVYLPDRNPYITDCSFSGNSAGDCGGGIFNEYYGYLAITNCSFSSNTSESYGGALYNVKSGLALNNCIFWNNTALSGGNEFAFVNSSTVDVDHCNVEGGQAGIYDDLSGNTINWGSGNIDVNPLFVRLPDDGGDGWGDDVETEEIDERANNDYGDLRLKGYSACINAGDPAGDYGGQVDLDGGVRVRYGLVDIGAYEVYPIAGDFEGDEDVDLVDFAGIAAVFGGDCSGGCEPFDIDGDLDVDMADVAYLVGHWLF